jgi:carbonic anhydrase
MAAAVHRSSSLQFLRSPVRRGSIPALGQTKPQILWIGCSSSGVQEPQVLGIPPEEIIVHRNIGNLLSNNDLSTQSSVEYAVKILKVCYDMIGAGESGKAEAD